MKVVKTFFLGAVLLAASGVMKAQMPCEPQPCDTTVNCDQPAWCYTPATGCGYNYDECDQPALIQRYAELAQKYRELGPNDRWSRIYNGDNEVKELQQIDNYYNTKGVPQGLTPEQELQLQTARGSVLR